MAELTVPNAISRIGRELPSNNRLEQPIGLEVIEVCINGERTTLAEPMTLAQLLERFATAGQPVAVELNRRVVPRRAHAETRLAANDELEIVTLVGGG
ncbi:MAG: sulfur carrier protein ThiS [Planctomycetota bacterium]